MSLSILPIYNPYLVRPRPVPPPRPNRTTNQPPIAQSASSPQLPAPVPHIINPDHPPNYSISHSSVDPPGNSSAQPPGDPPAHLQYHPYNDSPNPETKDSPYSPVIDVIRTDLID